MNNKEFTWQFPLLHADWIVLFKLLAIVFLIVLIAIFIYDRFIQRKNQLLINYPLIGRMRYLFYLLRNPMRQYFGDETYYDSFEDHYFERVYKPVLLLYLNGPEAPGQF